MENSWKCFTNKPMLRLTVLSYPSPFAVPRAIMTSHASE